MNIEEKFNILSIKWRNETCGMSNIYHKCNINESYQEIIKMGWEVVPFMLKDLKENGPNHWFPALEQITGENPIPKKHYGYMQKMTTDWIEWGKKKKLMG